jgi:hypothetical protein
LDEGTEYAITSGTVRAAVAAESIPWQVMILYSWTALSGRDWDGRPPEAVLSEGSSEHAVAMGITDDRARAMREGEAALESGMAALVIIEAVRPGMAEHTLAPCYVRTGVGWLARRTPVSWERFFLSDSPRLAGNCAVMTTKIPADPRRRRQSRYPP